ncbi:MAG: phospholipase [Rickettsiaceae bacterium]|jgi:phospholipase/carboxylesterase|nr:phospholipase [Rickettsiaceae bacterium]
MKELKFFESASLLKEKPKKLMVFLHGYGSNGEDLIGLAREFKNEFPDMHFISPNAPFALEHNFYPGYQWFSLANYDPQIIFPQILEANLILDNFIDLQLKRLEIDRKNLVVTGFSQGSMMAMYNSLRNTEEVGGVLAYSGRLILPTMLGEQIKSKPKICLIHGTADEVLPFDHFLEAKKILAQEKIPFEDHKIEGLGHGIDHNGIKIGRDFLSKIH